jgi:hypothetical protein
MTTYESLEAGLDLLVDPVQLQNLLVLDDRVRRSQMRRTRALLPNSESNIVGLGIAEKTATGQSTGDLALTFYVKKKYPNSQLPSAQRIPPALQLGAGDPLPTDVREVGKLRLESLTADVRPIVCGYSISGAAKDTTGTLGCLVRKRGNDTEEYILSNSHVLANSGLARRGDAVYQPGLGEKSTDRQKVAQLATWRPFNFGRGYTAQVDAAIAGPIDRKLFDPAIYAIGRPKGVRAVKRGMKVQKSGRTTGHTHGVVEDINHVLSMQYPRPPKGTRYGTVGFKNTVACTRFTDGGDSGSLVLDEDGYAIGLHFCGTSVTSIFLPISLVLDELGVELVT